MISDTLTEMITEIDAVEGVFEKIRQFDREARVANELQGQEAGAARYKTNRWFESITGRIAAVDLEAHAVKDVG